jgi:hypothetical protein
MWVNVHLKLDPRDRQSRELIELLKRLAETELARRTRRSYHPLDWFSGWVRGKLDERAARSGLVRRYKGGLP